MIVADFRIHLKRSDKHSMSYEELNDILGQGFYDGSYSSQKKANNLRACLNFI